MQIGRYFKLNELTRSQTAARNGLDNTPPAQALDNLAALCKFVLDPLREALNRPIYISSGYRSPEVNRLAKGSATSQHTRGEAADFDVQGMTPRGVFDFVRGSDLPFDQLILEFNSWVHISYSRSRRRGDCLIATRTAQGVHYERLAPATRERELGLAPASQIERRLEEQQAEQEAELPDADPLLPPPWPWPEVPDDPKPVSPPAPVAPPTTREISPQLITSGFRAALTVLGGILAAVGWVTPEDYNGWLTANFASLLSVVLIVGPYAWSWIEKRREAWKSNKAIVEALHREPEKADGTPVTPQDVKRIVADKEKQ